MSAHATVSTEIKSVAVLDRTLKVLGCEASRAAKGCYVAGRTVDGQQFDFPGTYGRVRGVAVLDTGIVHVDSDHRNALAKFTDRYSAEAVKYQAELSGRSYREGVNALGEVFVEVFT